MTERLVDFHCHLDLYPDFEALVRECDEEGIYTLAVTTTPLAWARNNEVASRTRHVRAALGLHPQLVARRRPDLALWKDLLPAARYVGEVGLDAGPAHFRSLDAQREVFREILLACSRAGGKVLSVHSVRATAPVLDMVEEHLDRDRCQVVLHWFSGSRADFRRAVGLGCRFSVNAQMMRSARTVSIIAQEVPACRILTETDGPFSERDGRPSRPADVGEAVTILSEAYGIPAARMATTVLSNLRALV